MKALSEICKEFNIPSVVLGATKELTDEEWLDEMFKCALVIMEIAESWKTVTLKMFAPYRKPYDLIPVKLTEGGWEI